MQICKRDSDEVKIVSMGDLDVLGRYGCQMHHPGTELGLAGGKSTYNNIVCDM